MLLSCTGLGTQQLPLTLACSLRQVSSARLRHLLADLLLGLHLGQPRLLLSAPLCPYPTLGLPCLAVLFLKLLPGVPAEWVVAMQRLCSGHGTVACYPARPLSLCMLLLAHVLYRTTGGPLVCVMCGDTELLLAPQGALPGLQHRPEQGTAV